MAGKIGSDHICPVKRRLGCELRFAVSERLETRADGHVARVILDHSLLPRSPNGRLVRLRFNCPNLRRASESAKLAPHAKGAKTIMKAREAQPIGNFMGP